MTIVKEFDGVRILEPVEADVIDMEPVNRTITMPAGSKGVVMHVHGPATNPLAYEVEFDVEELDANAIATVEADLVVPEHSA